MPSKPKTRAQLNALRINNAKKKTLNSNTPKNKPKPKSGRETFSAEMTSLGPGPQPSKPHPSPRSKALLKKMPALQKKADRPKTKSVNKIKSRPAVYVTPRTRSVVNATASVLQKKEKAFKAHKMYSVKTAKTMKEHLALKKKGYSHTKK